VFSSGEGHLPGDKACAGCQDLLQSATCPAQLPVPSETLPGASCRHAPERLPVLFPRDFFSGILLLRVPLLSDVSQRALVGRAHDSSFAFVDLSPALQAAGMAVKRVDLTQGLLSAVGTVLAENKDVAGQRNRAAEIRREPPEEPSHELHGTLEVSVGGGGRPPSVQSFQSQTPRLERCADHTELSREASTTQVDLFCRRRAHNGLIRGVRRHRLKDMRYRRYAPSAHIGAS